MAASVNPADYKEILLVLGTAGVVIPLFHRARVSPILGFLLVGAVLGPHGLGRLAPDAGWLSWVTVSSEAEIAPIAEFGVVFLMFMIGLELSFERLWMLRRILFGLGALQVAVTTAAIALAAVLLGRGAVEAAVIGAALSLASTAIVVQVLADERRLASAAGRTAFAVLLFQDLAVVPMLFVVAVMAARETSALGFGALVLLAQAVGVMGLIVVAGRFLLRPLFRLVAGARSPELFMAACLLVVIGTGVVAALGGQSMAIGAFVAGLLLAETEYRREIEVTIDPFKGLLLGVFFFSIGMSVDWGAIVSAPAAVALLLVGFLALKALIMFGLALAFRLPLAIAVETSLMLATAGEFAFVLLGNAARQGLVEEAAGNLVLVAASLSMALLPLIGRGVALMRPRLAARPAAAPAILVAPPHEAGPRVIVGGYGRVGQLIASILKEHAIPYIAVDSDPALVARCRDGEKALYYGDLSKPEFLRVCEIEHASALVLTMDSPPKVEAVVAAAKTTRPDLPIIARARDARDAHRLYELGVTEAVPETVEASLMLGEATLIGLGKPLGYVLASIHERRDAFKAEFQRLAPEARTAIARRRSISRVSVEEERKARAKVAEGGGGA